MSEFKLTASKEKEEDLSAQELKQKEAVDRATFLIIEGTLTMVFLFYLCNCLI